MISRLPKWVEYGAFLLALLAGLVNAVGLLGFQHQAVSHVSGTITLLGSKVVEGHPSLWHLCFILISFVFGAAISGWLFSSPALKLGRRYGVALCFEGTLLLIAYFLLLNHSHYGQYFASAACGLQNAMITSYSGAVVRTTHLTGIMTDIGLMLGARLRGESFDHRKAKLFLFIFSGFLSGGVVGALSFHKFQIHTMLIPAAMAFVIALAYWLYLGLKSQQEKHQ
ncbi:YoaK family protein [Vibrio sonorensis]|uniref:YoaK family protein n=1 Tax=Vibrio sonorensis TaxID=1004316 RepID=UPI0008D97161|nr:YoaK family protein [Vibrio sonorensis]